jgi:hypothetical protein
MLQHRGDAMHCTVCGREYDAQDEDLVEGGECPSDDCPDNDDEDFDDGMPEGDVTGCEDAGDVYDIEYDH